MEKDRIAQRQARERERLERRRLKELERIQKLERSRGFSSRTIIILPPSSSLPNALNTHTGTMFDADQPKSYGLIKSTFHTQSLKHYHNTTTHHNTRYEQNIGIQIRTGILEFIDTFDRTFCLVCSTRATPGRDNSSFVFVREDSSYREQQQQQRER